MNIAYTSMDNYSAYLGISMISLLENNQNEDVVIYILSDGISEKNCSLLRQIVTKYNQSIHFISVERYEEYFKKKNIDTGGFGCVVHLRLLLASILPENITKLIHIDCDTIINANIKKLWDLDVEEYFYRALPDFAMPRDHILELGLEEDFVYYNAGVMLVNLKKLRDDAMEEKYMQFCINHKVLKYADQDVMNCCCKGKIGMIPIRYNFAPNMYWYGAKYVKKMQPAYKDISLQEIKEAMQRPSIIHYMGDERPWIKGNHNKYSKYYYKYKKMSPWSELQQQGGKVGYMQVYFLLNLVTKVCPAFRTFFFQKIGINKFRWFGKK